MNNSTVLGIIYLRIEFYVYKLITYVYIFSVIIKGVLFYSKLAFIS